MGVVRRCEPSHLYYILWLMATPLGGGRWGAAASVLDTAAQHVTYNVLIIHDSLGKQCRCVASHGVAWSRMASHGVAWQSVAESSRDLEQTSSHVTSLSLSQSGGAGEKLCPWIQYKVELVLLQVLFNWVQSDQAQQLSVCFK